MKIIHHLRISAWHQLEVPDELWAAIHDVENPPDEDWDAFNTFISTNTPQIMDYADVRIDDETYTPVSQITEGEK